MEAWWISDTHRSRNPCAEGILSLESNLLSAASGSPRIFGPMYMYIVQLSVDEYLDASPKKPETVKIALMAYFKHIFIHYYVLFCSFMCNILIYVYLSVSIPCYVYILINVRFDLKGLRSVHIFFDNLRQK